MSAMMEEKESKDRNSSAPMEHSSGKLKYRFDSRKVWGKRKDLKVNLII